MVPEGELEEVRKWLMGSGGQAKSGADGSEWGQEVMSSEDTKKERLMAREGVRSPRDGGV